MKASGRDVILHALKEAIMERGNELFIPKVVEALSQKLTIE
jgi:hypothetical protein